MFLAQSLKTTPKKLSLSLFFFKKNPSACESDLRQLGVQQHLFVHKWTRLGDEGAWPLRPCR